MANREFKSDAFSMLMQEKKYALDVYNAINGSNHTDPEEIEIFMINKGIVLSIRNDASFIIDGGISIYEHQSTVNPNMAVRELIYYSNLIEEYVKTKKLNLYGKTKITIPTPQFVVFYNGKEECPEKEYIKLSDSFENKNLGINLEMTLVVYNINPDKSKDLLRLSKVLNGYTFFVERVRYHEKSIPLSDAIDVAMKECIENDYLAEFFLNHGDEVKRMTELDFTFEKQIELEKEASRLEGKIEGEEIKLIKLVCKKIAKNKTVEEIADDLEEDADKIKIIYDEAVKYKPDYDLQEIYDALHSGDVKSLW